MMCVALPRPTRLPDAITRRRISLISLISYTAGSLSHSATTRLGAAHAHCRNISHLISPNRILARKIICTKAVHYFLIIMKLKRQAPFRPVRRACLQAETDIAACMTS
jgi:hypothetical protein